MMMELQAMSSKIVTCCLHWNCFWQILLLRQKPFWILCKTNSLKNVKWRTKKWNKKTKKVFAWSIEWNCLFTYFWRKKMENLQCCLCRHLLNWIIKSYLKMTLYSVKYQHHNLIHLNKTNITWGIHQSLVSEQTMIIS